MPERVSVWRTAARTVWLAASAGHRRAPAPKLAGGWAGKGASATPVGKSGPPRWALANILASGAAKEPRACPVDEGTAGIGAGARGPAAESAGLPSARTPPPLGLSGPAATGLRRTRARAPPLGPAVGKGAPGIKARAAAAPRWGALLAPPLGLGPADSLKLRSAEADGEVMGEADGEADGEAEAKAASQFRARACRSSSGGG
mmetsp:Transcript_6319/g.14559  ORF Transcript_6319/g.14559 Transcript_6319/m.14559 type:complete len:203 (-) Transcript_6319:347-955(-)